MILKLIQQKHIYAAFNAKLEVVEPMGNEIFIYFSVEGNQFIARIPAR